MGISSFTITSEREEQANLISYVEVGSAYGVAAGNPKNFDPTNPCGKTIGVQTGTAQEDYATELSEQCVANGKDKITFETYVQMAYFERIIARANAPVSW